MTEAWHQWRDSVPWWSFDRIWNPDNYTCTIPNPLTTIMSRLRALTIKRKQWNKQHHINHFNQRWFRDAARLTGYSMIRCYDFAFVYLPHRFFPLFRFPWEFGVELIRNET